MDKIIKNPLHILNLTINTIINNPIILYPIFVLACIQVFLLEIIFFFVRYPFFKPLMRQITHTGEVHYPYNYILLEKCYYSIDTYSYILINCFFYANIILIVYFLDKNRSIDLKRITRYTFGAYIQLVLAMVLNVLTLKTLSYVYDLLFKRAELIQSTSGIYFLIKEAVIVPAPYVHYMFASLVVSLFAFIVPIILIEQKNIFAAIKLNFLGFSEALFLVFGVCLLSSLLYLPFLFYRLYFLEKCAISYPEISGVILVFSILTMLVVDTIQFTAISLCYLSSKDGSK